MALAEQTEKWKTETEEGQTVAPGEQTDALSLISDQPIFSLLPLLAFLSYLVETFDISRQSEYSRETASMHALSFILSCLVFFAHNSVR